MGPTIDGFNTFVRQVMSIPTSALPVGSPSIVWSYDISLMIVNPALGYGFPCPQPTLDSWDIYALAVFNLAADNLINYAPDVAGSTYFAKLRGPIADGGFGISQFVAGVVQAAADEGTSDSLVVPDAFKNLTISNLQNLKTPYGRAYLGLAQSYGPSVWGLT